MSHRVKHGESRTRLYRIWIGMKQRCISKNYHAYPDYGGRGITICEEWLNYESFSAWAKENGYKDNLQIDRIDNSKGYSPDNCRFATPRENTSNRRNTIKAVINGVEKPISYWAEEYGLNSDMIYRRYRQGVRGTDLIKKSCRSKVYV